MNQLARQILCWILTLTLSGFPLYSLSASQPELTQEPPCHEMMADVDTGTMSHSITERSGDNQQRAADCDGCNEGCICISSSACHNNSSSPAILLDVIATRDDDAQARFARSNSQLINRDIAPESSPPIA